MIRKHRDEGTVEFVLDDEASEIPHVVGSWDDWGLPGIPMLKGQGEPAAWKAIIPLPPGTYQFRYRVGRAWFNDPSADFFVDSGLGSENSVVIVEEAITKPARRASSSGGKKSRLKQESGPKLGGPA